MRRWILLGIFVLGASSSATPVLAGCTSDLMDCYQRAANVDDFWARWAAGLDCEFDYLECLRITLIAS
jgi:outer membrane murein-binding lipoprotein Lpp